MPKQQAETILRNDVHRELSKRGVTLFRNNVGQTVDRQCCPHCGGGFKGTPMQAGDIVIRYGVCNPGGGDLIGWTPRIIQPDMIGRQVAIFTSIETKVAGRKMTDPQENFWRTVRSSGGIAVLSRDVEQTVKECGV